MQSPAFPPLPRVTASVRCDHLIWEVVLATLSGTSLTSTNEISQFLALKCLPLPNYGGSLSLQNEDPPYIPKASILLIKDGTAFPPQEKSQYFWHLGVWSWGLSRPSPFYDTHSVMGLWQPLFQNQQGFLRIYLFGTCHFSPRDTTLISGWLVSILIQDYISLWNRCASNKDSSEFQTSVPV